MDGGHDTRVKGERGQARVGMVGRKSKGRGGKVRGEEDMKRKVRIDKDGETSGRSYLRDGE